MVSIMKGPRSFTAEDTVEINCHGGILVTRRVLDCVFKMGQHRHSLVSLQREPFKRTN